MMKTEQIRLSRIERTKSLLPGALQLDSVLHLLLNALAEDLTPDGNPASLGASPEDLDITSQATLPPETQLTGRIRAKATGVVAGLPVVAAVFTLVDENLETNLLVQEGSRVEPGMLLAEVIGPGRSLLVGERTALNFLGRMSGIASMTRQFVDAVQGTRATILDTRKTAPGLRHLDKYAVRMGGGSNHRTGLFDMVLIKDNHITGAGGITPAVDRVRSLFGGRYSIEVEVKNLQELKEALGLGVDRIMLDNMDPDTMRIAVNITAGSIPLEASGNVSLGSVRKIAETGVDFISSGALTHSAPTLDISMKIG